MLTPDLHRWTTCPRCGGLINVAHPCGCHPHEDEDDAFPSLAMLFLLLLASVGLGTLLVLACRLAIRVLGLWP